MLDLGGVRRDAMNRVCTKVETRFIASVIRILCPMPNAQCPMPNAQ
ncbi:MAG: hypothetical protein ACYTXP_23705 [Nostoc sp.]